MRRRELATHEREMGFVPSRSVRWLDPAELARTALKVALAKVFADYGDKREVQAVLPGGPVELPRTGAGTWIDYTADTGDGFAPTFTVATLLAQPELTVSTGAQAAVVLPRGDVLVLGGDEVYPAASARNYENRTTGPFSAAFPHLPGAVSPTLLAVPGNHDWYDGLTSFLRVFASGSRIGGWRTGQTRSYFVAALAPGWWLVGLDSQLGEYIDEPQLAYFRRNLTAHLQPGDAVIVCTASPGWVHTVTEGPDGFNQLHYFERTLVRNRSVAGSDATESTGAAVRVWLTGDIHHYSRYAEVTDSGAAHDPRSTQAITCGLGGAYLAQSHDLPDTLELPPAASRMRRKTVPGMPMTRVGPLYPDAAVSERLFRRVANPLSRFWLGWRNFGFLVGVGWLELVIIAFLGWILDLVQPGQGIVSIVRMPPEQVGRVFGITLLIVLMVLLTHGALAATFGVRGFVASLGAVFLIVAGCAALWIVIAVLPILPPIPLLAITAIVAWWLGGLLGTFAFGLFLLSQRSGTVASWRMSAQSIDACKGFLRMTVTEDDDLVIYPIVVDEVRRDWTLAPGPIGLVPVLTEGLPRIRLLEEPIIIARKGYDR